MLVILNCDIVFTGKGFMVFVYFGVSCLSSKIFMYGIALTGFWLKYFTSYG